MMNTPVTFPQPSYQTPVTHYPGTPTPSLNPPAIAPYEAPLAATQQQPGSYRPQYLLPEPTSTPGYPHTSPDGLLAPPQMGPYPQVSSATWLGVPSISGDGHSRPATPVSFNSATLVPSVQSHDPHSGHSQPRAPQNKPNETVFGNNDQHPKGCGCVIM